MRERGLQTAAVCTITGTAYVVHPYDCGAAESNQRGEHRGKHPAVILTPLLTGVCALQARGCTLAIVSEAPCFDPGVRRNNSFELSAAVVESGWSR